MQFGSVYSGSVVSTLQNVAIRKRSVRQEQILDGLIGLFLAEGFGAFSMADLAERLQCSKATLYELADSKEQLIAVVLRTFFRRATDQVEADLALVTDPVERIQAYLSAIGRALAPAGPAFYADLQSFTPAREIYAQNTAIAADRVRQLVQEAGPGDRSIDAAFLAAVAAQTMGAIQTGELAERTGLDDAAAYAQLGAVIVRAITDPTG